MDIVYRVGRATVGEVCGALRAVFGVYRPSVAV